MVWKKEQCEGIENLYGLIGKDISYSFSKGYFSKKFNLLKMANYEYINFDLPSIDLFKQVKILNNLKGLNVTIPYKESIIPYLDDIDSEALEIGAVNTIVLKNDRLIGYNTDCYGFEKSLKPLLKTHHNHALILGTGGASKAVAYTFKKNNISFLFVSRKPSSSNQIAYEYLDKEILEKHKIVVNCSPLGTYPKIEDKSPIPYKYITKQHILYDLVYNPSETTFLKLGKKQNATTKNGLEMLELQAEKSWDLWNN